MTGIPVISSLMGLGCIPSDVPEHLGMVGMHGTYAANMATIECDLLMGVGVRFDDRVTSLVKNFAPKAAIIHFDVDPAEVNKNVYAELKVIGDLQWSLPLLREKIAERNLEKEGWASVEWTAVVKGWKKEKPLLAVCRQEEFGLKLSLKRLVTLHRGMPSL
jgi:acetolactate synthase-1/2/3 large subunit